MLIDTREIFKKELACSIDISRQQSVMALPFGFPHIQSSDTVRSCVTVITSKPNTTNRYCSLLATSNSFIIIQPTSRTVLFSNKQGRLNEAEQLQESVNNNDD